MESFAYYNPFMERMSRERVLDIQWKKLKYQLNYLYQHNPFYRKKFQAAGITPEEIKRREDFRKKVPFTTKAEVMEDQERNPPYGSRLGVPLEKVLRFTLTSGTSGQGQEVYGITQADDEYVRSAWVNFYYRIGVRKEDLCVICPPLQAHLSGSYHSFISLLKLGAQVFHLGPFDTVGKLKMMQRFKPNFIYSSPTYLSRLSVVAQELRINPRKEFPQLKVILATAEPFPSVWAQRMEEFWGAKLHDLYGSTQLGFPLVTCEKGAIAEGKRGMLHGQEFYNLIEIIDEKTLEPVAPGEKGRLIITNLHKEASPVLRWDSGDITTYLPYHACDCGRPFDGIESGSVSRADDMIKIKMTNIWPLAVDEVIFCHEEIKEYQGRVWVSKKGREEVDLKLEFKEEVEEKKKKELIPLLGEEIKAKVGIRMKVEEALEPLPRFTWKARRWKDEREKDLRKIIVHTE